MKAFWSFNSFSLNDVRYHASFVLVIFLFASRQDSEAGKAAGSAGLLELESGSLTSRAIGTSYVVTPCLGFLRCEMSQE